MFKVRIVDEVGIRMTSLQMHCLPRVGDTIQFSPKGGGIEKCLHEVTKVCHVLPSHASEGYHEIGIHLKVVI